VFRALRSIGAAQIMYRHTPIYGVFKSCFWQGVAVLLRIYVLAVQMPKIVFVGKISVDSQV